MLLSGHLHYQTEMILFIILYMTLFFEMTSNIKNIALRCGSSGFPKKDARFLRLKCIPNLLSDDREGKIK